MRDGVVLPAYVKTPLPIAWNIRPSFQKYPPHIDLSNSAFKIGAIGLGLISDLNWASMVERRKPLVLSSTKILLDSLRNSARLNKRDGVAGNELSANESSPTLHLPVGILRLSDEKSVSSDPKLALLDDSALVGLPTSALKRLSVTSGSPVNFYYGGKLLPFGYWKNRGKLKVKKGNQKLYFVLFFEIMEDSTQLNVW